MKLCIDTNSKVVVQPECNLRPKQAQQILRHLDRAAKKAATLFIIAGGKDAILEPLVPLVLRSELSQIAKVLESY